MSDKDPAENWQLQNSGKTEDQWQLREAEQSVLDQLQLQPAAGASPAWQPVEYARPSSSSRRWILPSIVTVLLLAVVGYMLWVGLRSVLPAFIGALNPAETPAAPPPGEDVTPTAAAMAVVLAETPEPTPTPVVEQPTPVPTEAPPTPTAPAPAMVEQRFAVVNSPYGVNVRAQPTTDAPLLTLLENGRQVWALAEEGDWVEVLLADGELSLSTPISATTGWASAEFLTVTTGAVDPALHAAVMQAIGREAIAQPAPPAEAEVAPTVAPAGELVAPSLTVTSPTGLNIREQPSVDAPLIRLLENGATAPVVAVSDDGLWYQVRLDDGVLGWGFGEFVTITGSLEALPLPAAEAAPPAASSPPLTTTAPVTAPVAAPPAPAAPPVEGAVATVTRLLPVYATPDSSQPRISLVLSGAALPVVGRSADGAYVQVLLPAGEAAWAPVSGVELNVGAETLPVVDGG